MGEWEMRSEIRWAYGDKITTAQIEHVEQHFKVKFPKSYVDIVLEHDESNPKLQNEAGDWMDGVVDTPPIGPSGVCFISFKVQNNGYRTFLPMISDYESVQNWRDNLGFVIPFAENGGGDVFLFDYRENMEEPGVLFLDHEDPERILHPIAGSFDEFLDLLYPDDE
ncbi:SMI1/KNR4 family protein [Marinicrinis sediminis]|uniref:SMI1/KNR4 family protein n=1 Tax=Marinicrinis sediminis TaxID=1652465 RepID=A0ABW5RAF7_9BACL